MKVYRKGDQIQFRHRNKILTGWVADNAPVYDEEENIIGYMVHCPEFQGSVRAENVIEDEDDSPD